MVRPTEYDDLTTTSVKVERATLDAAKARGLNLSDVFRRALHQELRHAPKVRMDALEKFRGLPRHVVNNVARSLIRQPVDRERMAQFLSNNYGRCIEPSDLDALVPKL